MRRNCFLADLLAPRCVGIKAALIALALLISGCSQSPAAVPATTPITPTHQPSVTPLPATITPASLPSTLPRGMAVVFDDDGSPDGTTALAYLLSNPQVSVRAISISYGEAHPDIYIQHIGRKLDSMGFVDIPLGAGQNAPLAGSNEFPEAVRDSGDRFWGLPVPYPDRTYPVQDAASLIVTTANEAAEPVTIFVSGPATNLAQALRLDPGIQAHIRAVYMMGGAVYAPGNLSDLAPDLDNTAAEWNIYADPQAAKEVFESGLDVYLVPLDATSLVWVTIEDTGQWREGGLTANFAADIYDMMIVTWNWPNPFIWDVMTAAIMVEPDLCGFEALHLDVITDEGPRSGQTAVNAGEEPNVQVCLTPDVDGIRQHLTEVFASSE